MQEFPLGIRGTTQPCPVLSPGVHPPAAFRHSSGHEWKLNFLFALWAAVTLSEVEGAGSAASSPCQGFGALCCLWAAAGSVWVPDVSPGVAGTVSVSLKLC